MENPAASGRLLVAGILAGVVLLTAVAGLIYRRWRRQAPLARLRRVARALLADFVIPDGQGGQIHIQYALLTERGILVLDLKDVEGNVFGSETMQDWTVLSSRRRFTFPNPQPGLWDRVAAVRRLLPGVPVTGYIAFTARATFSRGRPRDVVMLETLLGETPARADEEAPVAPEALAAAWARLQDAARDAAMTRLLSRPA